MSKNRKGFTLIELLAVIIILGILLVIAVPAISRYIEDSRKNTYITAVKNIVSAVSTSINALEYPLLPNTGEAIIVPFSEVNLEKDATKIKSPYAPYAEGKSYVVVTFDGERYNYYVVALDEAGYSIPFVNDKELSTSSITINGDVINDYVYSLSQIEATRTSGFIDTPNITMKYTSKLGNIIKVKLCETIYSVGDIVQLKDDSKWYVIANSNEDNKTVNLVSYYHMETSSFLYGKQSNSKTTPIKVFDADRVIDYENADIYSTSEAIVVGTQVEFLRNGLDVTGATFSMPKVSDFSCSANYGIYSCSPSLSYLSGDGGFWTSGNNGSYVLAIANGAVSLTSAHYGNLSVDSGYGIRVVVTNLLKTNIDKAKTRALN